MARQKNENDKVAEEKPAGPARHSYFSTGPAGRGWLYALIGLIILAIVFMAGAAAGTFHRNFIRTGGFYGGQSLRFGGPRRMFGGYDGGINPTNGQTRLNGVVTSVNGSNFTIAGHGTTTNVTTNSSTQYQNGNQVKQNDSVIIFGADNNGTITASRIIINP